MAHLMVDPNPTTTWDSYNVLDTRRWETRDELRLALVTWIEAKYHRRRRQRGLGRLTPIEFETLLQPACQAA